MRVKQHCSRYLPLYMMPDRMILVDRLPQTSTDKTDYQKLRKLANEL
jgi:acyl-coenzyme A synthetase/AMP-(fatty) acid ligase